MKNKTAWIIVILLMCTAMFHLTACDLIDKITGKDDKPVEEVDLSEFENFDEEFSDDGSEYDRDEYYDQDDESTVYYDEESDDDVSPDAQSSQDDTDDSWESISDSDPGDSGSDEGAQDHYGPAAAARDKKNAGGSDSALNEEFGEYTGPGPSGYDRKNLNKQSGRGDEGNDSAYIISGSDRELLDKNDLKNMSDEQLRLAINEIYARHGRKFKSSDLQDYFNSRSWYSPKYEPDEFDRKQTSILSDVELKNLQILTAIRSERGN
ncbi:MAG: YARHG domain-containing protein [Lachnospiraceae bacterium]|nr:YARHG domain-containing protein [Lachnospiraceae bacterium]